MVCSRGMGDSKFGHQCMYSECRKNEILIIIEITKLKIEYVRFAALGNFVKV